MYEKQERNNNIVGSRTQMHGRTWLNREETLKPLAADKENVTVSIYRGLARYKKGAEYCSGTTEEMKACRVKVGTSKPETCLCPAVKELSGYSNSKRKGFMSPHSPKKTYRENQKSQALNIKGFQLNVSLLPSNVQSRPGRHLRKDSKCE